VKEKINIGFLGNQIAPGGGSTSLLLMLKSLDRSLFNVFVLTSDCASDKTRKEFEKHSQVVIVNRQLKQIVSCAGHKTGYFEWIRGIVTSKKQAKIVSDFVNNHNIKILHINNSVFTHLYKKIKQKAKVKIISHIREQVDLYDRKILESYIIKNIIKYSDEIITISDNEARPFLEKSPKVIPNPFDFNEINGLGFVDFRKEYKLQDDEILVAMMGRFAKDKGHLLFLQVANEILKGKDNPKCKFIIIGVNPPKTKLKLLIKRLLLRKDYRKEVEKYIQINKLENSVILVPHTSNILSLVKEMDVFVRPSLLGDPWGRDIIESMALSKPVVATGTAEFYVKDGKTGYLVNINEVGKFGEKMSTLINNKSKREVMGNEGFKVVHELCNTDIFRREIQKIYLRLA
jgi:glycosyltransferase involved in cell wall biosynthesis